MFSKVIHKFYLIGCLLGFLFLVGYAQLAFFLHNESQSALRGQEAVLFERDIRSLEDTFFQIRFWEKSVFSQDHPEADKEFGALMEQMGKRLGTLKAKQLDEDIKEELGYVSDFVTQYERTFNQIIQLKIEQRLGQTLFDSNYQSLTSNVFRSNESNLLKPLFNLSHFQEGYLSHHRESEYQALKVVMSSLENKLHKKELVDERLKGYLETYKNILDNDFSLEKEIQKLSAHFDEISVELTSHFLRLSEVAGEILETEMRVAARLRKQLNKSFIISMVLGMISVLLIFTFMARQIVHPIRAIANVAKNVRAGNIDTRFVSRGNQKDEVVRLGLHLNDMLDTLAEKNEQLLTYQKELEGKVRQLASLQEVSAAVVGELELESVLHLIAEKVGNLTKAETASVCLVSADNQRRTHVASYGVHADMIQGESLPVNEGQHGWVIKTGEPLLSRDFHEDKRVSSLGRKIEALSDIIVPLKVKEKIIGCLSAINKRENQRFTEDDVSLLALFANQAGIAIENAQLYQRQKNISEELTKSYVLLDEKNKELESFVYTVSHDLKAPLVSLGGFASILLNDYNESLDETGQLYLSRIRANVQKMGDLIQDLLELSRVGRIVNDYESVDVTEIIGEALETLEIQLSERGTELVIQDNLPTVNCDKVRIKQVFENLVSNANKFMGEENDKPKIEIGFHEKEDSFEFFVRDNGIGIQKEYQEKVFEIFTRLGDVEVEGTGVGLAIVKKIIETPGGKIWIDSDAGKGTTVYFTLPEARA